ncbi:MAG: glycosyltransferase [Phycisphaeraceae bacterium]|nr:glycosyltransferase [Phycisphaeraceae bacterium]
MNPSDHQLGVVVIGRNEGERLRRCLQSLRGRVDLMVYVDSGSTDGSVATARSLGVHGVELDLSTPFTMARGRNAGYRYLLSIAPQVKYVQFVDGDCEVVEGWIELARKTLDDQPRIAAVTGRRKERHPEASTYNRLCDLEWDGPAGEVRSTGGDVMMRIESLRPTGGFNEAMIAGEEGELCLRLRQAGWMIWRLDAPMTLHDAAMTKFSQWWKRARRAGHAYAESAAMHGRSSERYHVKPVASAWTWGLLLPLLTLICAAATPVWPLLSLVPLLFLVLLMVQGWRIRRGLRRRGWNASDASLYACFCLLAKTPQGLGVLEYRLNRWRGRRTALIEYKDLAAPVN